MRYPAATWLPAAEGNFKSGRAGKRRRVVCLHITAGPVGDEERSAVSWFRNPASEVSAHIVNGPSGHMTQMVDLDDTAYANGISYYTRAIDLPKGWTWQGVGWYSPRRQRVMPTWQLITQGINPNLEAISIEHAGQPNTPHPAEQIAATVDFLRWLASQQPDLAPWVVGRTLIGHHHLDPLGRANCPGPLIDLPAIAASANAPRRRIYLVTGLPIYSDSQLTKPSGRVLVPGQRVTLDRLAAEQPADYRSGAAHISDGEGGGFIDTAGTKPAEQ